MGFFQIFGEADDFFFRGFKIWRRWTIRWFCSLGVKDFLDLVDIQIANQRWRLLYKRKTKSRCTLRLYRIMTHGHCTEKGVTYNFKPIFFNCYSANSFWHNNFWHQFPSFRSSSIFSHWYWRLHDGIALPCLLRGRCQSGLWHAIRLVRHERS